MIARLRPHIRITYGTITRADYIEIAGVSPITATRDLARLARGKLLVAEGKTRSRIYRAKPDSKQPRTAPRILGLATANLIPEDQ